MQSPEPDPFKDLSFEQLINDIFGAGGGLNPFQRKIVRLFHDLYHEEPGQPEHIWSEFRSHPKRVGLMLIPLLSALLAGPYDSWPLLAIAVISLPVTLRFLFYKQIFHFDTARIVLLRKKPFRKRTYHRTDIRYADLRYAACQTTSDRYGKTSTFTLITKEGVKHSFVIQNWILAARLKEILDPLLSASEPQNTVLSAQRKITRLKWLFAIVTITGILHFALLPARNDARRQVARYIENSRPVTLTYEPLPANEQPPGTDRQGSVYIGGSGLFRFSKGPNYQLRYEKHTFRDAKSGRYFTLIKFLGPSKGYFGKMPTANLSIKARADRSDLADPAMGTFENPIPLLQYDIPPIRQIKRRKISDAAYNQAVYNYLTYLMPRQEFDLRFKPQ